MFREYGKQTPEQIIGANTAARELSLPANALIGINAGQLEQYTQKYSEAVRRGISDPEELSFVDGYYLEKPDGKYISKVWVPFDGTLQIDPKATVAVPKQTLIRCGDPTEERPEFYTNAEALSPSNPTTAFSESWSALTQTTQDLLNPYTPFTTNDSELRRRLAPFKDFVHQMNGSCPNASLVLPINIRLKPRSTHLHIREIRPGVHFAYNEWKPLDQISAAQFGADALQLTITPPHQDSRVHTMKVTV